MSRQYKISLLVALYLAQGLPFGFFTLALPVILREAGYSLTAISALVFLYIPWAVKFLWAPLLDRLGSRRTLLLVLQLSSTLAALLLAGLELQQNLVVVLIAAFVFNVIAASQDIVTDGLAVRMLDAQERALANAIQVGAYRIGMILGGGLLLWIFAKTDWSTMFRCMALLLALTVLPVVMLRDSSIRTTSKRPSVAYLLMGWVARLRTPELLGIAGLIFCYRFGDQMVSSLIAPFLSDQGLSKETIALMKGTVGSSTSLLGALAGGWFTFLVGRRIALLASGVAQAACYVLYLLAALGFGDESLLWAAAVSEGLIGTMATVALFTLMMDASAPEHAGTDYTVLASVVVLVGSLANFASALVADAFGYALSFAIGMLLALLGCLTLVWILDRYPLSARIAAAWQRPA